MSDVCKTGGPRWVNTVVRRPPGCWAWTASRSSLRRSRPANGSSSSRRRLSLLAARVVACGPKPMAAGRPRVRDLPQLVGGRWCCCGASASALRRAHLRRGYLDRAGGRDPSSGGADRASPGRSVPAGRQGRPPVAAVARDLGVGWQTVMRAVRDHGGPLVDDPQRLAGVAALGLDETSFLKATRVAPTRWVTGLVDLQRGRLLDLVADRTRAAVDGWLAPGRRSGWPRSLRWRWTPGAAMPARWSPRLPMPPWWWTTTTPSGWPTRGRPGPPQGAAGHPRASRPHPRPAVPLGRQRRGGRAVTPYPDGQGVGGRAPCHPHHRRLLQRAHPGRQPTHQEGQACRARLPQLHQPPPAAAIALRDHLGD